MLSRNTFHALFHPQVWSSLRDDEEYWERELCCACESLECRPRGREKKEKRCRFWEFTIEQLTEHVFSSYYLYFTLFFPSHLFTRDLLLLWWPVWESTNWLPFPFSHVCGIMMFYWFCCVCSSPTDASITFTHTNTGFDRSIPGYPRYSMIGNPQDGVHNLRIEDARIEDDGDYQCQIGPGTHSKPIRADSKVTVLGKCCVLPVLVFLSEIRVHLLLLITKTPGCYCVYFQGWMEQRKGRERGKLVGTN